MTTYVYTSYYGTEQDIAAGDTAFVLPAAAIYNTTGSGYGIHDASYATINVAGTVFGYYGVGVGVAGQTSYVAVDKGGLIVGTYDGIYVAGTHQVVNNGDIEALSGNGAGLDLPGAGSVVNNGNISGTYGIINSDATTTDTNYITNTGTLSGTAYAYYGGSSQNLFANSGVTTGSLYFGSGAGDILYNVGTVNVAGGFVGFGAGAGDILDNMGVVYSEAHGSGAVNMITFGSGTGDYLYNNGVIALMGATNAASNAVLLGSGAGDYLINTSSGAIYGNVSAGSGAGELIDNNGLIYGNVNLGNGATNVYYGQNGHLYGSVICGSGGDYVYSGTAAEPATAGTGNDYFHSANGAQMTINETAAAQLTNGYDTVANFQISNATTGAGTFLHIDASLHATTGFTSDGAGGTYVYMGLGGGNYSYIDVVGASVAQVQAQTYFA